MTRAPAAVDTTKPPARGQRIVIRLAASGHRLGVHIGELLDNADLASNVPVLVLCEISLRGPLRPRDLLEPTHLTSGALTKHLDHLEQLGLIKRSFGTVKGDRRASLVSLTAPFVELQDRHSTAQLVMANGVPPAASGTT